MNTKRRNVSDIIHFFLLALSATDAVGLAIEPIATMDDPDNEVDGDYSVRVSYPVGEDGRHTYIAVFNCSLRMGSLVFLSDEEINSVLLGILKSAMIYKLESQAKALHGGDGANVYGPHGLSPDLGEVLKRAAEMMSATKH